jgi:hypothetical protein
MLRYILNEPEKTRLSEYAKPCHPEKYFKHYYFENSKIPAE